MNILIKELLDQLAIKDAIVQASTPNDLLPSRLEDKVGGELGKEFVAHLTKSIQESKYSATKAAIIHVPKPGFTTRPAALLTLADRVVYESLVDSIRAKIEKKLISDKYVMWPRAVYSPKKWGEFERAPIESGEDYIVNIDITAFYDSIDHAILEDKIVQLVGENKNASCVSKFLSIIMGASRGLPQGLLPSDTLATLYLQSLDSAMLRFGFNYWRHGDDIRMSTSNYSLARQAIAIAEIELRKIGLVLNSSKCLIQKASTYDEHLLETSKVYELIKEKLFQSNVEKASSDAEVLEGKMDEAKLDDQLKWDLFYHQSVSVEEVINKISEHLQPSEVKIAEELFTSTLEGVPDGINPLPKDQFHVQLKKSLLRMAAGKSNLAISHCSSLIAKFPDKTELICNYLLALSSTEQGKIAEQVENVINTEIFFTSWQKAWIYRVMLQCVECLQDATKLKILKNCKDQYAHWLERLEGFKVLAKANELPFDLIAQSWELAPLAYKPDLIASAVYLAPNCNKSERFLEGIKQSPIEKIVARHCQVKLSKRK